MVAILGIDAADYELIQRWNCENLMLNKFSKMDTFSYSIDVPATMEVWPTIATGVHPKKHGIHLDPSKNRDNRLMALMTSLLQKSPPSIRSPLLNLKEEIFGSPSPTTDMPHIFDQGNVYNWPGITTCPDWDIEGKWFTAVNSGEMGERDFRRQHLANAGKGIGWLSGIAQSQVPIAGVHIHILDHMGHLYAKRPEKLRNIYKAVDDLVGWLTQVVDDLLIVSDHGMQTTETGDSDPGVHSWRAMVSSTLNSPLPQSVTDVAEWALCRVGTESEDTMTTIDAPNEHLRNLGYL